MYIAHALASNASHLQWSCALYELEWYVELTILCALAPKRRRERERDMNMCNNSKEMGCTCQVQLTSFICWPVYVLAQDMNLETKLCSRSPYKQPAHITYVTRACPPMLADMLHDVSDNLWWHCAHILMECLPDRRVRGCAGGESENEAGRWSLEWGLSLAQAQKCSALRRLIPSLPRRALRPWRCNERAIREQHLRLALPSTHINDTHAPRLHR
jgi:hypothetical protein